MNYSIQYSYAITVLDSTVDQYPLYSVSMFQYNRKVSEKQKCKAIHSSTDFNCHAISLKLN